ncbi:hypothetical protein [Gelidibacter mesophilus]|uniref:hypothetical protein n=1 Tax=Gelidibacter mesophilus TaxID=169050 RepID=UPI0004147553|nr:hypothetical protein [Gelidibacter mesophilus]
MEERFFTLSEVELNNNCPECFSRQGLKLTFKQRFIDNFFYKAITAETAHSLFCDVCKTKIFPIRWTEDIERVFKYQQRASPPRPASFKLKTQGWMLIGILITLVLFSMLFVFDVF